MIRPRAALLLSLAPLALAACQQDKPPAPAKAQAAGEVLEGSISDSMIPVDRVTSQPPLAPKSEASAEAKAKPSGSAASTSAAADEATPAKPADPGPATE